MLQLISRNVAPHRTIARLLGAFDVVVVDLPLIVGKDAWRFVSPDLPDLLTGIQNHVGLNPRALRPETLGRDLSEADQTTMHVVDGLHSHGSLHGAVLMDAISGYALRKNHPAQRLLVLTDTLFVSDEPSPYVGSPDVAYVQIEGL
jgi:hypothetical protein